MSPSVAESELLRLFGEHGNVLGVDLVEGQNFGYVRMQDPIEARNAIAALNGTLCSDATLIICAAVKRPPKQDPKASITPEVRNG